MTKKAEKFTSREKSIIIIFTLLIGCVLSFLPSFLNSNLLAMNVVGCTMIGLYIAGISNGMILAYQVIR